MCNLKSIFIYTIVSCILRNNGTAMNGASYRLWKRLIVMTGLDVFIVAADGHQKPVCIYMMPP